MFRWLAERLARPGRLVEIDEGVPGNGAPDLPLQPAVPVEARVADLRPMMAREALERAGYYVLTCMVDEQGVDWVGSMYALTRDLTEGIERRPHLFAIFTFDQAKVPKGEPVAVPSPVFSGTASDMVREIRLHLAGASTSRKPADGTSSPTDLPRKGGLGGRLKPVAHVEAPEPRPSSDPDEARRRNAALFYENAVRELERISQAGS